jgi:hypothetical protein
MPRSILRAVALPLLLIALSACNRNPPDPGQAVELARQEAQAISAKLAALPAQCMIGDAGGTTKEWLPAQRAEGEPGQLYTYVFTFMPAIRTDAFRVALNANALHNLEKVETRDAAGKWTAAWTGTPAGAPAGCEFVKMAQRLAGGEREVAALRITIRPDRAKVSVADVRVLKAE